MARPPQAREQQSGARHQEQHTADADHRGQRRTTIDAHPERTVTRPAGHLDVVPADTDVADVGNIQLLAEPLSWLVTERLHRDGWPDRQIDGDTGRRRRLDR